MSLAGTAAPLLCFGSAAALLRLRRTGVVVDALESRGNEAGEHLHVVLSADHGLGVPQFVDKRRAGLLGQRMSLRTGRTRRSLRERTSAPSLSREHLLPPSVSRRVEPTLGLEPRTCCLRNSCSATELCRRCPQPSGFAPRRGWATLSSWGGVHDTQVIHKDQNGSGSSSQVPSKIGRVVPASLVP
jgi:hypothetical protein